MDTLIRERNGKEEIWYSAEYLKKQIELAYQAGISKGTRIQFHAIVPTTGEAVDDLVNEFNKRIDEEFNKAFKNGEVWRTA